MTAPDGGGGQVVLLARTLAEANQARERWLPFVDELVAAGVVSSHQGVAALDGRRVRMVYVAPARRRGRITGMWWRCWGGCS